MIVRVKNIRVMEHWCYVTNITVCHHSVKGII